MTDDQLTRAEVDRIADEAAERATERVLRRMGIDAESFESVEEARRVWQWAKQAKDGSDQIRASVRKGAAYGAATTLGGGLAYMVWRVVEFAGKAKGG